MKRNSLRFEVILAAFVVVAAGVFGVQWLVNRWQVEQPVLGTAARVEGVRRAELRDDGGRVDLVVTLGPTRDFHATYQRLGEVLTRGYGRNGGRVVVRDARTPRLSRALYELNFALQEGLATGRYTEMRQVVEAQARALQLPPPHLWVEEGRIYVALQDGKAILYTVVARGSAAPGEKPAEGGGTLG